MTILAEPASCGRKLSSRLGTFCTAGQALLIISIFTSMGCATQFSPAGPSISMVVDGGQTYYVRCGKRYSGSLTGSGLIAAVEGNSTATERARAYRRRSLTGFWGTFAS